MHTGYYTHVDTEEGGSRMPSNVVKLRPETYERVKRIAQEQRASMQEVIARGVDALEKLEYARAFQEDFARLHKDPDAWSAEQREREAWDSALTDGIDG